MKTNFFVCLILTLLIFSSCDKPETTDVVLEKKAVVDTVVTHNVPVVIIVPNVQDTTTLVQPVTPIVQPTSSVVFKSDFSNFDHTDYGFTMPLGLRLTDAPNNTVPTTNYVTIENLNNQFKLTIKKECPYTYAFQQFIIVSKDRIYKNGKKYKTSFTIVETSSSNGYINDLQFGIFTGKNRNAGNVIILNNLMGNITGYHEFTDDVDWGSDLNLYLYFKAINIPDRTTDAYIIIDNLKVEEVQ